VPRQLTNEHGVSWLRSAQHGPATLPKQASVARLATNASHLLYAARRWVTLRRWRTRPCRTPKGVDLTVSTRDKIRNCARTVVVCCGRRPFAGLGRACRAAQNLIF
jgi:hypothetical protein